ncbi:MAG: hypothetical protein L7T62_03225 [Flavobacteriaceae bacterium]|nr:hypothetical protein [Flavobacteriaceae bacterium]
MKTIKHFGIIGTVIGFVLGFLYAVGGFISDYYHTGINSGSYLALNALWGMPILFGGMGIFLGSVIALIQRIIKKQ